MNTPIIAQTLAVWQPYSSKPLEAGDALEILHNMTGMFNLLSEWAQAEIGTVTDDQGAA